jgi:hypothetical protein
VSTPGKPPPGSVGGRVPDDAEYAFARALHEYKLRNNRLYPTCSEVLAVLVALGYRRVAPPSPLPTLKDVRTHHHHEE